MSQNGWLAFNTCREKNLESFQFVKSGLSGQYPAPVFCLLYQKNLPDKHYFGTLHRVFINLQPEAQKAVNVKSMEQ